LKAFLNFLALSLVTGPTGTSNGSFDGWIASSPHSSKGFNLESSPTSNEERSETLNVALTPYSPDRSTLYILVLLGCTTNLNSWGFLILYSLVSYHLVDTYTFPL
jgi:hypothetical protein